MQDDFSHFIKPEGFQVDSFQIEKITKHRLPHYLLA